jgi:hypothetical protein
MFVKTVTADSGESELQDIIGTFKSQMPMLLYLCNSHSDNKFPPTAHLHVVYNKEKKWETSRRYGSERHAHVKSGVLFQP